MASSLGAIVRTTKTSLVDHSYRAASEDFEKRFSLAEGDYVEYERKTSHGLQLTPARICEVETVYFNKRGGYTAVIKVMPLVGGGKVGVTRSVFVSINANGTGLKGMWGIFRVLRRVGVNRYTE